MNTIWRWTLMLALLGCAGEDELDDDGDGYVAADDCDDQDPNVNPGADEVCDNNTDDDCDGVVDDDGVGALIFYLDADGDLYGDAATTVRACTAPDTFVPNSDDCNDADADIHPGVDDDNCDGVDDDCDGSVDEQSPDIDVYVDGDGDGYGAGPAQQACRAEEGFSLTDDDCRDSDELAFPGADERCNGLDDDCDEVADEGVLGSGEACPATTCEAILVDQPTATDGEYWLAFDEAYALTCDMSGGGFTVFSGADLRALDLVSFDHIAGIAGALENGWTGDPEFGVIYMHPRRKNLERTDCDTAVLRATAELPFTFREWRGGFSVKYWGQDNRAAFSTVIRDCDRAAFLFSNGLSNPKVPGTWGAGGSGIERTVSWATEELEADLVSFFWELNGYTTAITPLSGEESALISDIEIAVR